VISSRINFTPNFMKIRQLVQNLKVKQTHIRVPQWFNKFLVFLSEYTVRQNGYAENGSFFFQNLTCLSL
jgi:hypothetical protein